MSAVVIGLAIAGLLPTGSASAQPGQPPCVGMLNTLEMPVDPKLEALNGQANVRAVDQSVGQEKVDEVHLAWSADVAAKGGECIWIQVRLPGSEYSSFADFILNPEDKALVHSPGPVAGQYCYRLFALSKAGRSDPAEMCVNVDNPRRPAPPTTDQPAPPNAGIGQESGGQSLLWRLAAMTAILSGLGLWLIPAIRRGIRRP